VSTEAVVGSENNSGLAEDFRRNGEVRSPTKSPRKLARYLRSGVNILKLFLTTVVFGKPFKPGLKPGVFF
jgi:hypothetical protein